jgi:hypothetical protein
MSVNRRRRNSWKQDVYDEVVVQKALELHCDCEFLTLENGSLGNEVLSPRLTSKMGQVHSAPKTSKSALYRKVSDVLPG